MFGVDDFLLIAGSIIISALIYVAVTLVAWLIAEAMVALINYIKKIGTRIAVLRKKKALDKFIDAARSQGKNDIANELQKVKDNAQGILTPTSDNGIEDWSKLKLVDTKDKEHDEMADAFMFSDVGRAKMI
ncbi:MAG: hypothetical protein K5787_19045 [Lentisphaeria bacterium]|nr:hypothetical protein [Lentisphaeria bacterium]